jgi:hypothetical protein
LRRSRWRDHDAAPLCFKSCLARSRCGADLGDRVCVQCDCAARHHTYRHDCERRFLDDWAHDPSVSIHFRPRVDTYQAGGLDLAGGYRYFFSHRPTFADRSISTRTSLRRGTFRVHGAPVGYHHRSGGMGSVPHQPCLRRRGYCHSKRSLPDLAGTHDQRSSDRGRNGGAHDAALSGGSLDH